MNMLDGVFRRERGVVEVAGADLPAHEARWPDLQAIRIAIGPEDLHLAGQAGAATFSGQVEVVMDLGHFRQVEVVVDETHRLKLFLPKDQVVVSGQTLHIAPSPLFELPWRCRADQMHPARPAGAGKVRPTPTRPFVRRR